MSAASGYFSSFLTQTTNKYNSLKQAIISSEADGDTEDDSHISRVLRAYYTEKGRPFPEWLPPDPKAPPPPPVQIYNSRYGAQSQAQGHQQQQQQQPGAQGRWAGRGGGLSDLWDAPKQQSIDAQNVPTSLRAGRNPAQAPPQQQPSSRPGRFGDLYDNNLSQSRLGLQDHRTTSPVPSVGSGSAKDMLKAKLWGGARSGSPVLSTAGGASGYSSPAPSQQSGGVKSSNPYEDRGSQNSRGGGGDREFYDRNHGGAQRHNPYETAGNYGDQPSRGGLPTGPRPRRF